jgi:peptidoglycan/LPS O-acetylase OafA/YrhL
MKETFPALNGLRFVAALAVVFFHYGPSVTGYQLLPRCIQNLVQCGPVALGFFFILSGFVLTHAHPSLSGRRLRITFWFRRFAKLYPVYFFAFLLFIPIAIEKYLLHPAGISGPGNTDTFFRAALLSGLMLQAWTSFSQAWNGPGWSLSVEAFFYVIFPFILPLLSKLRIRNVVLVCGVAWTAMVSVTYAQTLNGGPSELWTTLLRNNPLLWSPMFLIGVSLARLIPAWARVSPLIANLTCALSAAGILLACAICPIQYRQLLITGGLAGLLATLVLAYSHRGAMLSRMFGNPILDALGRVSYITYIIQAPLWHFFQIGSSRLLQRNSWNGSVAGWEFSIYLALLICSSFLVQAFIEEPCRIKLTEYFNYFAGPRLTGPITYIEHLARSGPAEGRAPTDGDLVA